MANAKRPGMMLYFDDMEALDEISNAEFGRLIRLLRDYALTGEKQKVKGSLNVVYQMMIKKVDQDQKRYEKICQANSEAAKRRWEKQADADACERIDTHTEQMRNMPTTTVNSTATVNPTATTTTTQQQNAAPVCNAPMEEGCCGDGGEGEVLSSSLTSLIEKYRSYSGETYLLVKENFKVLSDQYTTDWLSRAIDCAIRSGNMKISYIRGILRNWQKAGKPDESEFRQNVECHTNSNPYLNYAQRTDSLEHLYMDL